MSAAAEQIVELRPPNPLQEAMCAAILADKAVIGVRAGVGSGKTMGSLMCAMLVAELAPGCNMLWLTDTYPHMGMFIVPKCEAVLKPDGWRWHGDAKDRYWQHPNGSRLYLRSFYLPSTKNSRQTGIEGADLMLLMIDECQALPEAVYSVGLKRMRQKSDRVRPVIIMTGLPMLGAWWQKAAEERRAKDGRGVVLLAKSTVNAGNYADDYLTTLESLSDEERRAMVENDPQPLTGAVYRMWSSANIVKDADFKYDAKWTGHVYADFGLNKPAGGVIVHWPERNADVIVADVCPRKANGVSVGEFGEAILRQSGGRWRSWPRAYRSQAPAGFDGYWLDAGTGDKAGRATNDQTLMSTIDVLARPPDAAEPRRGGLGIRLYTETDRFKVHVPNGVACMKRQILDERTGHRGLLILESVWEEGLRRKENSFAKAIAAYAYPDKGGDEPNKTGIEDPLDGPRYHCVRWHWHNNPLAGRIRSSIPTGPTSPVADYMGAR